MISASVNESLPVDNRNIITINERTSPDSTVEAWRERTDLCTLFLQGNCPHGISGKNCPNFHPHICNRYRKNGCHPRYGCQLENACKHFHPIICPNSLRSHTCYTLECKFRWHLPRTRRNVPNVQGGRYQNSGYNKRIVGRSQKQSYRRYQNPDKNYFNSLAGKNHTDARNYNPRLPIIRHPDSRDHYIGASDVQGRGRGHGGRGWESQVSDEPHANMNEKVPANYNNFFSLQNIQQSISQKVQEALAALNIPSQIEQELTKFQRNFLITANSNQKLLPQHNYQDSQNFHKQDQELQQMPQDASPSQLNYQQSLQLNPQLPPLNIPFPAHQHQHFQSQTQPILQHC